MSVPCVLPLLGIPVQCQAPIMGCRGQIWRSPSHGDGPQDGLGVGISPQLWGVGWQERGDTQGTRTKRGGHKWIHTLLPLHRGLVSHCIAILKVRQGMARVAVVTLVVMAALVLLVELVAPVALVTLVSMVDSTCRNGNSDVVTGGTGADGRWHLWHWY